MIRKLTAEQSAKNTKGQNAAFNKTRARVFLNMINTYEPFHGEIFEGWSSGLGIQPCGVDEFGMPDFAVAVYYKEILPKDLPSELEGVKIVYMRLGEIHEDSSEIEEWGEGV